MPIYDYHCRQCDGTFTALVSSSATPSGEVTCPACGRSDAEKLLSLRTAVLTGGAPGAVASSSSNKCDTGFY